MAQAKKPTTTKSPISSMGLTFESGNPANYPIAYGDNIWDIAQQNSELADKLGGVGQYDQHTINEVFAGGISKIAETIQSLAQLPAAPKKGDTYRIREATTATVREYADNVIPAADWRLFTADESYYIGNTRPNAANLQSPATVCGVMGLLLLPDAWDWNADERLKFYNREFVPVVYYDELTFNESEWAVMEQYGAVFLPMANFFYIEGGAAPTYHVPYKANERTGLYLSSTQQKAQYATMWQIFFNAKPDANADGRFKKNTVNFKDDWATSFCSSSIRLVQDAESDTVGAFSTGENTYIKFAPGNVQYKPSIGRCRFAPTQYSFVSDDDMNTYLAQGTIRMDRNNADVWIDRFVTGYNQCNPLDGREYFDYLVEKQIIYPAGSLIQWNGAQWQWLNGYQNGNLLSNEDFNKVKKLNPVANSGSYNDLTDKPTKVSDFENDNFYAQIAAPVAMDGYKQLAYIESDKDYSQYIDTNIKPNQNTGFEIDFSTPHAPKNATGQPVIFNAGGKKAAVARFGIALYTTKPGGEFAVNTNKSAIDPKLVANKRLVLKYQNRVFTYTDGTTAEMPEIDEFETANTLFLFAGNNEGGVAQFASVRLYSFKVYDGTALQAHFVPAQRLSDGIVGLYEAVSNTFFENLGDGAFAGADIDFVINRASQLINDQNLVSDNKYVHTDNNFNNTYKGYVDNFNNTYKDKVDANEAAIAILNGDEETAGSVQNTVVAKIAEVVAEAPASFDTLKEISDWITNHAESAAAMNTAIQSKVDKEQGKGLSTNDYTTAEKNKLAGLNQYVYICKNYAGSTTKTIEAATHGCGVAPFVVCYLAGNVVDLDIACNTSGDVTVGWSGLANITPANPLTISIIGMAVTAEEEQEPIHDASDYPYLRFNKINNTQNCSVSANSNLNVNSITIPEKVILNGEELTVTAVSSLSNAVITEIVLPDTITKISDNPFMRSNISTIHIGKNVSDIGWSLGYCKTMQNIIVDEDNPNYKSVDGVLFNKNLTKIISYPIGKELSKYTIPSTVTEIERSAFMGCSNIGELVIPDSVTTIGSYAFFEARLDSIFIPASVTNMGYAIIDTYTGSASEFDGGGVDSTTIYCEAAERPSGWPRDWDNGENVDFNVVWGATRPNNN